MTLSNEKSEGLQIETEGLNNLFPANFCVVKWICVAVDLYDDIEGVPYYEFNQIKITECYYFNSDNQEVDFIPNDEQFIFMKPSIEKDALTELQKQL